MLDRAVGVLVASAAGDALGVPYEFGTRPLDDDPQQLGGGLGDYEVGEWSDDTQMASVIAKVAATGADLRTTDSLDAIARGFLDWYASGPGDVGTQTRAVLSRASRGAHTAENMTAVSEDFHAQTGKSAGNGSLMRTGPVAVAYVGRTAALVEAARAISALTHFDPIAQDACVLWCLAIEHTIRTGELDIRVGLPHVSADCVALLDAADVGEPSSFRNNSWVVAALQAAWAAVRDATSLRDALLRAVRAGGDTDTVAAIAGSLAGARWGGSAVPFEWRRRLHGWPGLRARDLTALAVLALQGGETTGSGWPMCPRMTEYDGSRPRIVDHPDDPGVLMGNAAALQPGVADAVVSLCRLGTEQVPLAGVAPEDHAEVWLVDMEDANVDLHVTLAEAARAVKLLRDEGKTVLLHCVHAETRTPVVAAAYGALITGSTTEAALARVREAMPGSIEPRRSIVKELLTLTFNEKESARG
jgi:ADP-ribosylglycohydrolase